MRGRGFPYAVLGAVQHHGVALMAIACLREDAIDEGGLATLSYSEAGTNLTALQLARDVLSFGAASVERSVI